MRHVPLELERWTSSSQLVAPLHQSPPIAASSAHPCSLYPLYIPSQYTPYDNSFAQIECTAINASRARFKIKQSQALSFNRNSKDVKKSMCRWELRTLISVIHLSCYWMAACCWTRADGFVDWAALTGLDWTTSMAGVSSEWTVIED